MACRDWLLAQIEFTVAALDFAGGSAISFMPFGRAS